MAKKPKVPKRPGVPARKAGGYARAAVLSPQRRKEIAQKAANTRWARYKAAKKKKG